MPVRCAICDVNNDTASRGGHSAYSGVEAFPAVASRAAKDVAGPTSKMNVDENLLASAHVASHERQMGALIEQPAVPKSKELTPCSGKLCLHDALNDPLVTLLVRAHVLNAHKKKLVVQCISSKVVALRCSAIIELYLSEDAGRDEICQLGKFDRGFSQTGPVEHAERPRP
jgi:hypothetical protein